MTATQGAQLSYAEVVNDPKLNLTAFERQCGLLWPVHQCVATIAALVNPQEYADRADYSRTKWKAFQQGAERRVRWAVNRAFGQIEALYYGEVREAAREHQRAIVAACRNRKESGRTSETHVGVKPYGALDNDALAERRGWDDYVAARDNPENYRPVSLRGAVVSTAMVGKAKSPAERLTTFARHLSAQQELASASI